MVDNELLEIAKQNWGENKSSSHEQKKDDEHSFDHEMAKYTDAFVKTKLIGAGLKELITPGEVTSKSSDSTAMMTSMTALVNTLLDKVLKMNTVEQKNPYYDHLETELKDMKEKLDGSNRDPIEAITYSIDGVRKLSETMRSHLGLSSIPAGTDPMIMLRMEEMKQEGEERREEAKTYRAERARQWELEDRRWLAEHELKKQELSDKKEGDDRRARSFADVVDMVMGSVETGDSEQGISQGISQQAPSPEVVIDLRKFKCSQCGNPITVPDEATKLECSCGAEYDVKVRKSSVSQD